MRELYHKPHTVTSHPHPQVRRTAFRASALLYDYAGDYGVWGLRFRVKELRVEGCVNTTINHAS